MWDFSECVIVIVIDVFLTSSHRRDWQEEGSIIFKGETRHAKGEVELRDTRHKAARTLRIVQRSQSYRGVAASLEPGIGSTMLRLNNVEIVQFWVMHDVDFAHSIPRERS